jgi:hypothetical protein
MSQELLMATRRHQRQVVEEAEPVLAAVDSQGYLELVTDDGQSFEFSPVNVAALLRVLGEAA